MRIAQQRVGNRRRRYVVTHFHDLDLVISIPKTAHDGCVARVVVHPVYG